MNIKVTESYKKLQEYFAIRPDLAHEMQYVYFETVKDKILYTGESQTLFKMLIPNDILTFKRAEKNSR